MAIRLIDGSEFLHIPKTGGSWVETALESCGLIKTRFLHKHATYGRVINRGRFNNWSLINTFIDVSLRRIATAIGQEKRAARERTAFRFCFVRHPLSWYESYWKYMKGRGWNDWGQMDSQFNWHPNAVLNGLGSDDFNDFMRNVIRRRPSYVTELYSSYVGPGIDFVGRTESLVDDLIGVLKSRCVEFDESMIRGLQRVNISKTKASEIEWDPRLKKTVMALELPALSYFGYLTETERDAFGILDESLMCPALHRVPATTPVRSKRRLAVAGE